MLLLLFYIFSSSVVEIHLGVVTELLEFFFTEVVWEGVNSVTLLSVGKKLGIVFSEVLGFFFFLLALP